MPGAQSNRLAGSIHYMVVSEEESTSLTFIGNVHARQSSALMNFTFVVDKTHLIKKRYVFNRREEICVFNAHKQYICSRVKENMASDLSPGPCRLCLAQFA